MKITREADYAIRILSVLSKRSGVLKATTISGLTGVTLRFALKILHKLIGEGIVESFCGASGGYRLIVSPAELSVGRIIETIDGPIRINDCLYEDAVCSRVGDVQKCAFHHIFADINEQIRAELYKKTLDQISDPL